MADLNEFQSKIGYTFKNRHLLEQALTHSSYANEKHLKKHSDNERLEFLGDAVLEMVSSEFLFTISAKASGRELTKPRASMVCEPTLALCTRDMDLGNTFAWKRRGCNRRKKERSVHRMQWRL